MTKLNVATLIIDLPEFKSQPQLWPKFINIRHNGQEVFSGGLTFDPETGKAIIDVSKNNVNLSKAIDLGSGFLPLQFEVSEFSEVFDEAVMAPIRSKLVLNPQRKRISLMIEGHLCKNGNLCGLVRKFGQFLRAPDLPCRDVFHDKLSYVGFLDPQTGEPTGSSYRLLVGGSILYSEDAQTVAYIYTDNRTAVVGEFDSFGLLIKGQKVRVKSSTCDDNGMLVTQFTTPIQLEAFYTYKPPTKEEFGGQPLIPDEVAIDFVEVKHISDFKVFAHYYRQKAALITFLKFQGDGTFAKIDIEQGIIIMQYGGNRLGINEQLSGNRQITGHPYAHIIGMCDSMIDIPFGYTDVLKYNGTLAHKTNHNFINNINTVIVSCIVLDMTGHSTEFGDFVVVYFFQWIFQYICRFCVQPL
jgi:hypothetical protein